MNDLLPIENGPSPFSPTDQSSRPSRSTAIGQTQSDKPGAPGRVGATQRGGGAGRKSSIGVESANDSAPRP